MNCTPTVFELNCTSSIKVYADRVVDCKVDVQKSELEQIRARKLQQQRASMSRRNVLKPKPTGAGPKRLKSAPITSSSKNLKPTPTSSTPTRQKSGTIGGRTIRTNPPTPATNTPDRRHSELKQQQHRAVIKPRSSLKAALAASATSKNSTTLKPKPTGTAPQRLKSAPIATSSKIMKLNPADRNHSRSNIPTPTAVTPDRRHSDPTSKKTLINNSQKNNNNYCVELYADRVKNCKVDVKKSELELIRARKEQQHRTIVKPQTSSLKAALAASTSSANTTSVKDESNYIKIAKQKLRQQSTRNILKPKPTGTVPQRLRSAPITTEASRERTRYYFPLDEMMPFPSLNNPCAELLSEEAAAVKRAEQIAQEAEALLRLVVEQEAICLNGATAA